MRVCSWRLVDFLALAPLCADTRASQISWSPVATTVPSESSRLLEPSTACCKIVCERVVTKFFVSKYGRTVTAFKMLDSARH
eukprot:TRINITY_DN10011_c0_g1_i1.p1 TRINITY_DN10011_c0_g1~~TRINITY_DN10011_c0_g1_i1.p1  ORF type:complete len:82 (+),score=0.19 TRINITY_DN10011_c0_g1_i1:99-344(+)